MKCSYLFVAVIVVGSGCEDRTSTTPDSGSSRPGVPGCILPQRPSKDIDILFVVDNSNSTLQQQANLSIQFPALVDAMRSVAFGKDASGKECSESNTAGCKIPNVRIGVVSSDLGAGNYALPGCEVSGGDGGKLQATPRMAGCMPPSQPWISYNEGVTNIKSSTVDSIAQVKEAFQCIAELGTGGCGFEHTIEAARRALDPNLNINKSFIRKDANLAIVFLTEEDDCSARKASLFDPQQTDLSDPLGPLTSFRCFEFGVQCECVGGAPCTRTTAGPRTNCKPAHDWLYRIDDYVKFFSGLKPKGRVILAAIAGPTGTVEVGMHGQHPGLKSSCQSSTTGAAHPAIRIRALVDGFGDRGLFNVGVDSASKKRREVNICHADYSPALRLLGQVIAASLGSLCIAGPPVTETGGAVCSAGDLLGTRLDGTPVRCAASCLERAACVVSLVEDSGQRTPVARCDAARFGDVGSADCGARCPCWRISRSADCAARGGSPYQMEVLRKGGVAVGQAVEFRCATSPHKWNTAAFAAAAETGQCQ